MLYLSIGNFIYYCAMRLLDRQKAGQYHKYIENMRKKGTAMMSLAKEYIKRLREREQGLFPEPLKESALTETDILEIERGLGYALPEQYREFLQ